MYKLTKFNSITRLADNASIPIAKDNTDYKEYLEWVAKGNTPAPVDIEVPTIPQEVSMRQARLALSEAGHLAAIETALAAMAEPAKTKALIEWEYSQTVARKRGLVVSIATSLGLTEAQTDALFVRAAAL